MEVVETIVEHFIVLNSKISVRKFVSLKYVVPADNDMCIYDIQFAYEDEVLECRVRSQEEAFKGHRQLEQEDYSITFAESGPSGKIEAKQQMFFQMKLFECQ
jgi:hypothetical protein